MCRGAGIRILGFCGRICSWDRVWFRVSCCKLGDGMRLRFNRRPGLVVYVTCGDPSVAVTRDVVLDAIDAGADVIELGVPFSDPVADGPVIQRASERALLNGTTLGDVLKLAGELRG